MQGIGGNTEPGEGRNARGPGLGDGPDGTFFELLEIVRRRGRLVAWVWGGVVGVTLLVSLFSSSVYTGRGSLHIEHERPVLSFAQLETFGAPSDPVLSEIEILRSRSLAEEVVQDLNLHVTREHGPSEIPFEVTGLSTPPLEDERRYRFVFGQPPNRFNVLRDETGEIIGSGELGRRFQSAEVTCTLQARPRQGDAFVLRVIPFQLAVRDLQERTSIEQRGNTKIVDIQVSAYSPTVAADTVNAISRAYRQSTVRRRAEQAAATKGFVAARLTSLESLLKEAERGVTEFKARSGIVSLSEDAERTLAPLTETELQRGKLRAAREESQEILKALRAPQISDNGPLVVSTSGIPNPVVADLGAYLSDLELRYSRLSGGYSPGHPTMQALSEEIVQAKVKLAMEVEATLATLRTREKALGSVIDDYESELRDLPAKEFGLAERLRESRVNQELYTILRQRLAEAEIAEASTIANAYIIDPAVIPHAPSSPRLWLNLAISTVLGLCLGVGVAFLLYYFDQSVRTVEDLARVNLPTFGVVPEMNSRRPTITTVAKRKANEEFQGSPLLIASSESVDFISESYRSLRTSIRFAYPTESTPCLALTSAVPGEGKSLTTSNLAISLAESGRRVLLADADLRRPTLHRLFGVRKVVGLSQILVGAAQWEETITATGVDGLDLITAGQLPPNPAELLGSPAMGELIGSLKSSYDVVIIDTPPSLPFSDTAAFSCAVDGVFLVVRARSTSLAAVARTRDSLTEVGARVRGAILNRISFEEGFRVKGYTSSYYYYYQDQGRDDSKAAGWQPARLFNMGRLVLDRCRGRRAVSDTLERRRPDHATAKAAAGVGPGAGGDRASSSPL